MKTPSKLLTIYIIAFCVSCGKIEDKQVTISYGPAKKAVRLGDYYWTEQSGSDAVFALDSKMQLVGMINKSDNASDYQTVLEFMKKSGN